MSKVSMTIGQIMDLGLWDQVCQYKGLNPYMLNEGQATRDEIIEFDSNFEKEEEIDDKKEIIKIIENIEGLASDLYDLDVGISKIISSACDRVREVV